MKQACGLTLIEMVVTIAIIAILASIALPYAEVSHRREQEIALRRALRDIRTAVDRFHDDWSEGLVSGVSGVASADGYPTKLEVLVQGVELRDGKKRKYLRRVPRDPFSEGGKNWRRIGYRDANDSLTWNGQDVYDVVTISDRKALDGSFYRDW